ncbi:MAG TPA: cbb3-type cytochrome c oxidase subunit I, partial [Gemmatimonadaceae bacterium]|nr:cbb3-type cytochrome c oxidase subunit I [Gemmatimonadaceae bacterium]
HPLLWQHLFWMFGHPWVYVVVLPAMGIVSDALPTFCRRPLVGYTFVALATVMTAMIGFGVWLHHMFATGIAPLALAFFGAASIFISIPSAVAIFAWLGTLWDGKPWYPAPMKFMLGFIALFVIGGVSGVMTAAVPLDWQLTDTYFIVAHLHYVLVGINVFPVIAGVYYWFPKMTGRMMDERLGTWNFWTLFVGVNLVFFPMHIVGLLGMPRRIYSYPAGLGWDTYNLIETIGAFVFAVGVALFAANVWISRRRGRIAGPNPWDAGTLEWSVSSPPPPYNFAVIPTVGSRHPLWEDRLGEGSSRSILEKGPLLADGRETFATTPLDAEPSAVLQMPEDTYLPLALAISIGVIGYGLLFGLIWLASIGGIVSAACVITWLWPARVTTEERETDTEFGELPVGASGRHNIGWWGMACVVATEAAFFGYLLFSYYYLGSLSTNPWPDVVPRIGLPAINTLVLISSSVAVWMAARGIRRNSNTRLVGWLGTAIVLGVVFISLQVVEYGREKFSMTHDAYGSLFYTITGFHGAHVIVGLLMLVVVFIRAARGHFRAGRHEAITNVALYWHFVDVVWLAVFTSLYITPHLR